MSDLEQRQIAVEQRSVDEGIARYWENANSMVHRGDGGSMKAAERMIRHWLPAMEAYVVKERRDLKAGRAGQGRSFFAAPLLEIEPKVSAYITLRNMLGWCLRDPDGVPMSKLAYQIGHDMLAEMHARLIKEHPEAKLSDLDRRYRNATPANINTFARKTLGEPAWSTKVSMAVGARLIWMAVEVSSAAGYDEDFVLAFHHSRRTVRHNRRIPFIQMDDRVFELIHDGHLIRQALRPRYAPMVCKPRSWEETGSGGYLTLRRSLVTNKLRMRGQNYGDLTKVHKAVDVLNSTPWQINVQVLEVAQELWRQGGNFPGMPPANERTLPPKPHDIDTNAEAKKAWKRDAAEVHTLNAREKGVRAEFIWKCVTAERYAGQTIYFPHELDFRGRIYPVPQPLNHQGDDICRGLLEFGTAKPTQDLRWVKIHTANSFGYDKATLDEREKWCDRHAAEIEQIISDPIKNQSWMEADSPWQFLAGCYALGDGEAAARLPIQVDGSCNGLQHYSAIGRDPVGASMVNLTPGAAPSDVYTGVAEAVYRMVESHAAEGREEAQGILPEIDRKLVKQPVMTSVYGVTFSGIRSQIANRLQERGWRKKEIGPVITYISHVTRDAMDEVCVGASSIMSWIQKCARIIAEDGNLVSWTTPTGFRCQQNYAKGCRERIVLSTGEMWYYVAPSSNPRPYIGKQVNGSAPNWIHGVDAAHVAAVAIECDREGMDVAAVHDSDWSHAADMDLFNHIIRDTFVDLHAEPLHERLYDEWSGMYPRLNLPSPPPTGDFDLSRVMESEYFFS